MKIYTLADVTLSGGTDQVISTPTPCKWYRIYGVTIATTLRVGDSNVGATRGAPVTTSAPFLAEPISQFPDNYDLSDVYCKGSNTDKVGVIYGV